MHQLMDETLAAPRIKESVPVPASILVESVPRRANPLTSLHRRPGVTPLLLGLAGSLTLLSPLTAHAGEVAKPRLAQLNQDDANQPAAAPQEQPRGLEVPVNPDKTPPTREPNPAPVPADPNAKIPVTPPPATGTPVTPPDTTTPGTPLPEAEGREISDVRVVGNRVIPSETILAQVRTQRGAAYSTRQAELDRGRIGQLGFFASVQAQAAPDPTETNKVVVTFIVVENRVISAIRFEGNSLVNSADLIKVLESKVGVVLNSQTVTRDVQAVQKAYSDKGFAVLVQSAAQQDDGSLVFTLQEARISRIELSGLKKTRESLVRKIIRTKPGESFDTAKLRKDLNRIYDLGFFEDVTFKVDDDPNQPGSVIVTFLLKERRTGQLSLGVGFDSRSHLSGFASLSESNLRGRGQRGLVSVELGSRRNFEVGYGNPFIGPKNASYDISIYNRTIFREPTLVEQAGGANVSNDFTYEEERTGARLNFSQPLDFDRTNTILYGYRNEKARLFQRDSDGNATPVTGKDGNPLDSSGRVSAFSLGYLRDKRDLKLDPSSGSRQQFIVEQAVSILGDTTFTKFDADLRNYFPLMKAEKPGAQPKLVFASRLVLGAALNQLPPFEQYYVGGSDTVRGYDSDAQFGDNQAYGNLELRYRFNRQFQLVGFVDAGKAYGGNFTSGGSLLYSAGGGVRVQTPLGPIRLDIGIGKDGAKTHFGIGPTF